MKFFERGIYFFVVIFFFWLPYSPAVIESSVIVVLVLWFFKQIFVTLKSRPAAGMSFSNFKFFPNTVRPPPNFLNYPIVIFIFACLVSVFGSVFFERSLHGFLTKTGEWFVIYYMVLEAIKSKRQFEGIIAVYIFTSMATCFDAIIQYHVTARDFFAGRVISAGGATAAFKNYNDFGGYLTFLVPVIFSFFWRSEKKYLKFIWLTAFFISLWALMITFSRGAWLGVCFGLFYFLLIGGAKKLIFVLGSISIFLGYTYIFISQDIMQFFRLDRNSLFGTMASRLELWQDTLRIITDRPFWGHGLNTYMPILQASRKLAFEPTYAHNCYLQMAAEIGWIGLGCFLGIVMMIFIVLTKRIRIKIKKEEQKRESSFLTLGLLCGILGFLVQSFFDTNFYSLQLVALFWSMVGLTVYSEKLLN